MTSSNGSSPADLMALFFPWLGKAAPDTLVQPILPGWSLINITENNSSAPDTERRIVAQDSYGRQIGRIMDVVAALVAERPKDAPAGKAFSDFETLRKRVEKEKTQAAADRLTRVREDLERLKQEDPKAYAVQVAALRALLGTQPPSTARRPSAGSSVKKPSRPRAR
jgi:hypothetical protein